MHELEKQVLGSESDIDAGDGRRSIVSIEEV